MMQHSIVGQPESRASVLKGQERARRHEVVKEFDHVLRMMARSDPHQPIRDERQLLREIFHLDSFQDSTELHP